MRSAPFHPQVLCRRSDVLWALDTDSGRSGADAREALARAPRPVLHLLRSNDLARVAQEEREEVYRHNAPEQQETCHDMGDRQLGIEAKLELMMSFYERENLEMHWQLTAHL